MTRKAGAHSIFQPRFPANFSPHFRYTRRVRRLLVVHRDRVFRHASRSRLPEFAGVSPYFREIVKNRRTHWWEQLNDANQIGSTAIFTNNIRVTFYAFALGAIFGLGTLYVLAFNGASFGAILALCYRAGFENDLLLGFVITHGVIELTCIFIAGGAGFLIGTALLMPGNLSRGDALKSRGIGVVL